MVDLTTDDTVVASGSDDINLQPLDGQSYKIFKFNIYILDPVGSTAGTHSINMFYDDTNVYTRTATAFCYIRATTGNNVFTNYTAFNGDSSELPSSATIQSQMNMGSYEIWSTYDDPIIIRYNNDTDVSQTGDRYLKFLVGVYKNAV